MAPVPMPQSIWQALADSRPLIPMYIHLVLSSLLPIYTGAHASLTRPSSAAKPKKNRKHRDDDDEDETVHKMEGLSPQDAVIFPVTAGLVLMGLYWLIKKYGAELINLILGWYFSVVGVYSVAKLVNDAITVGMSFCFPSYYSDLGRLWSVDQSIREAKSEGDNSKVTRASPLPGYLCRIPLPTSFADGFWRLRSASTQKYAVHAFAKGIFDLKANLTLLNVLSSLAGISAIAYANLVAKPWWLTNLQGFAVCYSALQFMSPTTFGTGSLILAGLFFYDIWAVFFTPFMVSVAKNLDQPIKLVFPRPDEPGKPGEPPQKAFSMLGLGDIVLPGIMIGLALRYDLHMHYLRKQKKSTKLSNNDNGDEDIVKKVSYVPVTGRWGDWFWTSRSDRPLHITETAFPKPYFTASTVGYVIGMLTTLGVMSVSQQAQPALLYLVPGVLVSLWGTALVRGELSEMWNFSEAATGAALVEEDGKKSDSKDERSWSQYLWEELFGSKPVNEKTTSNDAKAPRSSNGKLKDGTSAEESEASTADPDMIVSMSITRYPLSRPTSLSEPGSQDAASSTDLDSATDGRPAMKTRSAKSKAGTTS